MRDWNRHSHNFQAPPQHSHSRLYRSPLHSPKKNRKETTTTAKKIAETTTANNLSRLCQYRKEGARKQGAMIHQLPLRPQMPGGKKNLGTLVLPAWARAADPNSTRKNEEKCGLGCCTNQAAR